jgi:putative endonuclease
METIQTLKTFLARFAKAPAPTRVDPHPSPRPGRRSELYAAVPPAPDAKSPSTRTVRQQDGDEGERHARRYLECAGLTFVAANVRFRDGEIDLVMREKPRPSLSTPSLVFVEVRRRSRADHGGAAGSITREKRRRIVAAAAHYLVGLGLRTLPPSRFDVVTIDGDHADDLRIAWIRDAFRDEG